MLLIMQGDDHESRSYDTVLHDYKLPSLAIITTLEYCSSI